MRVTNDHGITRAGRHEGHQQDRLEAEGEAGLGEGRRRLTASRTRRSRPRSSRATSSSARSSARTSSAPPVYKKVGKAKLRNGKATVTLKKLTKGKNKLVFEITLKGGKYGNAEVAKTVKVKKKR